MNKRLLAKIEKFLSVKSGCRGGEWPASIAQKDISDLYSVFYGIVRAKFGTDYSGACPVVFQICDKTSENFIHTSYPPKTFLDSENPPHPSSMTKKEKEAVSALVFNVYAMAEHLKIEWRAHELKRLRREQAANTPTPRSPQ